MADFPQCCRCGKFCRPVMWMMVYSGGWPPEPDHEKFLCQRCLDESGPFVPQHGIKPEFSCGFIEQEELSND